MFDDILFDLDGTLTDPFEGITNSVAYALGKSGVIPPDNRELISFIGPPLHVSFAEKYGFDSERAMKAVEYYREYFAVKGLYENKIYPDTERMLIRIKEMNKRIILATSKPEEYAVIILRHFGIDKYFDIIAGASMSTERSAKADVIAYALEKAGTDKSRAVMVGDRKHDIIGAKANGLKSVGVLYGYGTEEELAHAGADYIIKTPSELIDII